MQEGSKPIGNQVSRTSGSRKGEIRLTTHISIAAEKREKRCVYLPPKLLLAKLLAARAEAAYSGYESTKNVKMPPKTSNVLHFITGGQ
jgi:hypothetical protein